MSGPTTVLVCPNCGEVRHHYPCVKCGSGQSATPIEMVRADGFSAREVELAEAIRLITDRLGERGGKLGVYVDRAKALLEGGGVERTHALVPALIAERTALRYRLLAAEADNASRPVFATLMREWEACWVAAARGERDVQWPETSA
jgi:hypothetical protein